MKHAVIGIIFQNNQNKVLCVQRQDNQMWVIPGGAVDPGESCEEAVVREIKEETGLDVEIVRKVGEYHPYKVISTTTHVYECLPYKGVPQVSEEILNIGYYHINKLPQVFFLLHEIWINEAKENRPEMIKRQVTEVTPTSIFTYTLKHPIYTFKFIFAKLRHILFG